MAPPSSSFFLSTSFEPAPFPFTISFLPFKRFLSKGRFDTLRGWERQPHLCFTRAWKTTHLSVRGCGWTRRRNNKHVLGARTDVQERMRVDRVAADVAPRGGPKTSKAVNRCRRDVVRCPSSTWEDNGDVSTRVGAELALQKRLAGPSNRRRTSVPPSKPPPADLEASIRRTRIHGCHVGCVSTDTVWPLFVHRDTGRRGGSRTKRGDVFPGRCPGIQPPLDRSRGWGWIVV